MGLLINGKRFDTSERSLDKTYQKKKPQVLFGFLSFFVAQHFLDLFFLLV